MTVRQIAHEGHADVLELVRARDDDGVLDADLLAQLAGDAVLVDHDGDLACLREAVSAAINEPLHLERLEGADVDAELAAGAEFFMDFSLRDLLRLDLFDEDLLVVVDRVDGAIDAAD